MTDDRLLDEARLRALVDDWASECGQRVKVRREALNLTQLHLARMIGATTQTVSKIENGEVLPRDRVKVALAVALMCDVADVYPHPDRRLVLQFAATKVA